LTSDSAGESPSVALALVSLDDINGAQFTAINTIAIALRAARSEGDDLSLVTLDDECEFSTARTGEVVAPNLVSVLIRQTGQMVGRQNSSVRYALCIDMHFGDRRGVFGNSSSDIHRGVGP